MDDRERLGVDTMAVRRIILEKMPVSCGVEIGETMRQSLNVDVLTNEIACTLSYRLKAFVLTDQYINKDIYTSIKTPQTWWEHFKQQYFPQWFKRRWPIKYSVIQKRINVRFLRTFPYANIAIEKRLGKSYVLEQRTEYTEI